MYNISELERKWIQYRRKRVMKIVLYAVGVIALVLGPLAYVTLKGSDENAKGNKAAPVHPSPAVSGRGAVALNPSQPPAKEPPRKAAADILTPQIPSMQPKTPVQKPERKKPKMLITLTDKNAVATEAPQEHKQIKLQMVDTRNQAVVKEIEQRFPLTKDYDDAMYLAKYYYGKRKYKKAEYWAMQANAIDSTQEESWIIFGKAIAKRGHRADALRVLQAYYDRSGSIRVKELIDRIRKGKKY